MKRFTRFGRNIFLWFLLVSLLSLMAVSITTYVYMRIQIKDRALDELEYDAGKYRDHVRTLLEAWVWRATDFSSDGFIRDATRDIVLGVANDADAVNKLNVHLRINKKGLHPDMLEVFVLNKDGVVIASSSETQVGKDLSKMDYFRRPFVSFEVSGGVFAGDEECSTTPDHTELVFSRILKDRVYQSPIGVIALRVSMSGLLGIIRGDTGTFTDGGYGRLLAKAYITNKDGWLIADLPSVGNETPRRRIDTDNIRRVLSTKIASLGEYVNYGGTEVMGATLFINETAWTVTAERKKQEIFEPLKGLAYMFGGITGFSLLLILGLSFAISSSVNKSIRELVRGTEKIAKGDLDYRITLKRNDELGILSDSFNAMIDSLKTSTMERERLFSVVERAKIEWERTFDSIEDAILNCDTNLLIARANKGATRTLNVDPGTLIGKGCLEVFSSMHGLKQLIAKSSESLKPTSKKLYDPGRDKTFFVSVHPVVSKGTFQGTVLILHDVSVVEKAEKELESMRVIAMTKLAELAEKRHPETGHHLFRVKGYCRIIAEELRTRPKYRGLIDDQFVKVLLEVSILHDIGKVAAPDSVLLKPGPLTPEEFELIKVHTIVGEEILSGPEHFRTAREVCRYHHERWDGKGYPDGLEGEKIPLHARIISLADTYDALVSERPYRKAYTHEQARSIILEESGSQFDPDIVEVFIKREHEFGALRERNDLV